MLPRLPFSSDEQPPPEMIARSLTTQTPLALFLRKHGNKFLADEEDHLIFGHNTEHGPCLIYVRHLPQRHLLWARAELPFAVSEELEADAFILINQLNQLADNTCLSLVEPNIVLRVSTIAPSEREWPAEFCSQFLDNLFGSIRCVPPPLHSLLVAGIDVHTAWTAFFARFEQRGKPSPESN
jgi:hypothetical protein